MPHASHQPPAPEPPQKRAGSSDAARRHGLIRDHTVFHVVASCRARPAIVAPSKRNCRIAQRIARTMSTTESHTEGLSNQVARRLAPDRTSALHGASPGRLSGRRLDMSTDLTLFTHPVFGNLCTIVDGEPSTSAQRMPPPHWALSLPCSMSLLKSLVPTAPLASLSTPARPSSPPLPTKSSLTYKNSIEKS